MKQKRKIHFGKLIGNEYTLVEKMFLLDWMLKTGRKHRKAVGRWHVAGISQWLLDYSANDHDTQFNLLSYDLNWFFDAVFSRAVYKPSGIVVEGWRKDERIYPNRFRYFEIDTTLKKEYEEEPYRLHYTSWMLHRIEEYNGLLLNKELHHPDYEDRTLPKIIDLKLYTIGTGWILGYTFSFMELDYEPGWSNSIKQNESESINDFLFRAIKWIDSRIEKPKYPL